jgi:integrase
VARVRHYSPRTEDCYVHWATRYILFHGKRHPCDRGAAEIDSFLTDLAVRGHVSSSTQTQALNALIFLYTQVLHLEVGRLDAVRARRARRLPVVLTPDEVRRVLEAVQGGTGVFRLTADLLYGCGLPLLECCQLRVKDVDLSRGQILVRQGKGDKDRVVMLPRTVRDRLRERVGARAAPHQRDLGRGPRANARQISTTMAS